jgi:hypothetical protein
VESRRRRVSFIAAAAAAAAVAIFAAAGAALSPVGPKPLSVSLLTTSQQRILSEGFVKGHVSARRAGPVKVRVSLRGADSSRGGDSSRITKPRTLHFKGAGSRTVRLKLNGRAASLLASCREQTLSLFAKRKASPRAHAFSFAGLDRDSALCKQASGGPPPAKPPVDLGPDQPPGGTSPGPAISNAGRCDWLDPSVCLYPWPNDYFTTADPSSSTGRRLALDTQSMPTNRFGVPIIAGPYNVADGFSPGNMAITRIPGFDNQQAFDNTGAVPITDMARYADPNQPVVVINADTGERQPIWAEIDANPPSDGERTLIIRPARNFDEGGHYIVALRDLKDAAGNPIQPGLGFRVYRDRLITPQEPIEARRPHMEALFQTLQAAGIKRMNLNLAWDFTVASEKTLTHRARDIRDNAFSVLGDPNLSDMQVQGASPGFDVTSSTDFTPAQDARIAREVKGTVTVPCYLNLPSCPPGSQFQIDPATDDPVVLPGNTAQANFQCEIPRSAIDGAPNPARPSLYGHGLLGSASEVGGGNIKAMASEHNMMFCATDWAGFSTSDVPSVLLILQDVNNFPKLADRTQQGFLNFMFLGRAMIHDNGFSSDPAFQVNGQSLIDKTRLFYDGNSQGGILGGALTALAPDYNRAVLGVPAMNYSTLLERSTDFAPYAEGKFTDTLCDVTDIPPEACALLPDDSPFGLYDNYPDQLTRPLLFSIMQLLWDRAEPDGYAHHITTDPLPNTPPHEVLMHPAFGDHQVANVAAEVEARTIGASAYKPALFPGRSLDAEPLFGIPAIPGFPFDGSAIVFWDGGPVDPSNPGGTTPAPTTDTPPDPVLNGADPHSYPRNDLKARAQKSAFLMVNGMVHNYCLAENLGVTDPAALVADTGTPIPCYSHGYTGP